MDTNNFDLSSYKLPNSSFFHAHSVDFARADRFLDEVTSRDKLLPSECSAVSGSKKSYDEDVSLMFSDIEDTFADLLKYWGNVKNAKYWRAIDVTNEEHVQFRWILKVGIEFHYVAWYRES